MQRAQWRKLKAGQNSYLTPERLAELEAAGFVFGNIDRRHYPVDECGVWPKPYQLKKRSRKVVDDNSDGDEDAEVVGSDEDDDEENNQDEASDDEEEEEEEHGGDEVETGTDLGLNNEGHGMKDDNGTEEENEVVAAEVLEELQLEPEPVSPVFIKGRWVCSSCQKDEFLHFVDACAHEAACSEMQFAAVESL